MRRFIIGSQKRYLSTLFQCQDPLKQELLQIAEKICLTASQQDKMSLQRVLNFWTTARMIEGGWEFADCPGLDLVVNAECQVLLTQSPFIDYQFSLLVVSFLASSREKILEDLRSRLRKHTSNWMIYFIMLFFILDSMGLVVRQQLRFGRKNGQVSI